MLGKIYSLLSAPSPLSSRGLASPTRILLMLLSLDKGIPSSEGTLPHPPIALSAIPLMI